MLEWDQGKMRFMGVEFMDKKLFGIAIIFLMFLLMPIISALEFDNVKSYNPVTKTVTITNAFGFGEVIGQAKLNTPLDFHVPQGYQKVAEFEIINYDDYKDALKDLQLYDKKNKTLKTIIRDYDYKYLTYENVSVDDYGEVCGKLLVNGSVVCSYEIIGNHLEEREKWIKLTPSDLKKNGVLTIGIFTEVLKDDVVEWIPSIFGVDVEEWATWTEDLNVGIVRYYNFDSGEDLEEKVYGIYNLTNVGGSTGETGILGESVYVAGGSEYLRNLPVGLPAGANQRTLNFWFYTTISVPAYDELIGYGENTGTQMFRIRANGANQISFEGIGADYDNIYAYPNNQWTMITLTYNGTGVTFYVDGSFVGGKALGLNTNHGDEYFTVGARSSNGKAIDAYTQGKFDEVGIWNRTLTTSEISDLWNGGSGITYTSTFSSSPTISLNFPDNNYYSNNLSITFNCSATDNVAVNNLTLVVGGVDNEIVTGSGNLSLQKTIAFSDDSNGNWTCYAYDDEATIGTTSTRTFQVHTGSPTFTLNSLENATTISMPTNVSLNVTSTDPYLSSCWYVTSENATSTIYTCNTTQNIPFSTGGSKTITVYANDTYGNSNSSTYPVSIYYFNATQSGQATIGEGTEQTMSLLVNSTSFAIGDASATLWYDGVNKGVTTKTVLDANSIYFTTTFVVANETGNATGKDVNWLWSYNTTQLTTTNTTTQTQTVYTVAITDCAITSGRIILNLSLKDEETNSLVNITSPNVANIELDLEVTSSDDDSIFWKFSKQWIGNNSVAVCLPNGLLNLSTYRIDFVAGYDATDHVREFYYMDNGTLDNTNYFNSYTSNSINLFDLLSADSTTFLFEYTDQDNQLVDDIVVHTFRNYIGEGIYREVERSKQDNSGQTHIHLVEEDVIYYFMITQYGQNLFTSDNFNAKCLSTPCEITLSASATETNWSIIDNEGGKYVITVNKATRVVTTKFNLDTISTINSSVYRFFNGTSYLINSSTLTSTSGAINIHIPLVYDNSTFYVAIFNDGEFIKSQWISLQESAIDYFGTFGAILGGLIILAMMLMAVSEGAGFIVFTILAIIIVMAMQLVDLSWMAIISIVCAGGIIIFKLVNRRGSRQ